MQKPRAQVKSMFCNFFGDFWLYVGGGGLSQKGSKIGSKKK